MRIRWNGDKIFASILAIGFLSLVIVFPAIVTRETAKTYEIFSNQDFEKYKFEGEGTEHNPYVIENLSILYAKKRAIIIENTTSYFIIRNNTIKFNAFNAISIKSIAPGTAKIYNNTCVGHSTEGIKIVSSDFVEITNNTWLDNKIGIGIYDSNNCTVEYNQLLRTIPFSEKAPIYSVGLLLLNSNFTSIINNYFLYPATGIDLENSNYCMINNNNIVRSFTNGIFMKFSSFCIVNNTIMHQIRHNGINLRYAHHNVLENSRSSENTQGIVLHHSNQNQLSFNQIIQNEIGILVTESSSENIFELNEIINNLYDGFKIVSGSFNKIHHNDFYYNNLAYVIQASDSGIDNLWYDNVTSEGNYWSSWNSSLPYELLGSANNTDPFPLSDPVSLVFKQSLLVSHLQLLTSSSSVYLLCCQSLRFLRASKII